jgi:hypothetical protein
MPKLRCVLFTMKLASSLTYMFIDGYQFQEISHAYSVLSDKEKRKRYDQYGDAEDDGDMDMNDFMQVC